MRTLEFIASKMKLIASTIKYTTDGNDENDNDINEIFWNIELSPENLADDDNDINEIFWNIEENPENLADDENDINEIFWQEHKCIVADG